MKNKKNNTDDLNEAIEQFKKGIPKTDLKKMKEIKGPGEPSDYLGLAINCACKDMVFRDLKPKQGKGGNKFKKEIKGTLTQKFQEYFDNPPLSNVEYFDNWHNEICKITLEIIKNHYDRQYHPEDKIPRYGKAQKIINMTFKYLYCFIDRKQYGQYFEFCQMPLDSITLDWYKERADYKSNTKWSNLDEDEYTNITNGIRGLIYGGNYTVLQSEFIIWPKMQLKKETENFRKQLRKSGYLITMLEEQVPLQDDIYGIQSILNQENQ